MKRTVSSEVSTKQQRDPRDARTDRVHLYGALYGIPSTLGGMTTSVLRRTANFIKYGSPLSATILTFSPNLDVEKTHDWLVKEGLMDRAVSIRNLWVDLRAMDDAAITDTFNGETPPAVIPLPTGTKEVVTKNYTRFLDGSGKVVGQVHYRDDGTLLCVDINEKKKPRRVIVHTTDGKPAVEWDRARTLYNQWLQFVINKDPALLIVDSGPIAALAHEIEPRTFRLVHFVHVSHLKSPTEGIYGDYVANRTAAFRDQEHFDYVAVQTQQQLNDMAKLGLSKARMYNIPSEIPHSAIRDPNNQDRKENQGVMAARLVELKQIGHAVEAISMVNKSSRSVTLDICGTGDQQQYLQSHIDTLGETENVHLLGHVANVTDRFSEASFSLLTSKYEGLGLAVVESMAAGCIPISYNIKYGPDEIITDGVNGYVVGEGDVAGLASKIREFQALDGETKQMMREAAVARARDYLPEQGYARWKKMLVTPIEPHVPAEFRDEEYLRIRDIAISPKEQATRISVVFEDKEEIRSRNLRLIVVARKKNRFFQAVSSSDGWQRTDGRSTYNFTLTDELFTQSKGETFDLHIRRIGGRWDSKVRLKLPSKFDMITTKNLRWYRTEYGNFSMKCLQDGSKA